MRIRLDGVSTDEYLRLLPCCDGLCECNFHDSCPTYQRGFSVDLHQRCPWILPSRFIIVGSRRGPYIRSKLTGRTYKQNVHSDSVVSDTFLGYRLCLVFHCNGWLVSFAYPDIGHHGYHDQTTGGGLHWVLAKKETLEESSCSLVVSEELKLIQCYHTHYI